MINFLGPLVPSNIKGTFGLVVLFVQGSCSLNLYFHVCQLKSLASHQAMVKKKKWKETKILLVGYFRGKEFHMMGNSDKNDNCCSWEFGIYYFEFERWDFIKSAPWTAFMKFEKSSILTIPHKGTSPPYIKRKRVSGVNKIKQKRCRLQCPKKEIKEKASTRSPPASYNFTPKRTLLFAP